MGQRALPGACMDVLGEQALCSNAACLLVSLGQPLLAQGLYSTTHSQPLGAAAVVRHCKPLLGLLLGCIDNRRVRLDFGIQTGAIVGTADYMVELCGPDNSTETDQKQACCNHDNILV